MVPGRTRTAIGAAVIQNMIRERLLADFPGIQDLLFFSVPESGKRGCIEKLLAELYFTLSDTNADEHLSVLTMAGVLPSIKNAYGRDVIEIVDSLSGTFDQIVESVVTGYLNAEGEQRTLLLEILKDADSTQAFIDCSKSFLLACTLEMSRGAPDANAITGSLIAAYHRRLGALDLLQRLQMARIERTVKQDRPVVAFFCPDKAFRKNFGR